LKQSVISCLAQTHSKFEFIICDDGSTDSSWEYLQACRDPRVRLLRNEENRGNPFTRNRLLDAAGGRYIAWADADDVYHPGRLARQLAYMQAHPDCTVVSACMNRIVDGRLRLKSEGKQASEHAVLRLEMLFNCPLNNPLAFIRAESLHGLRYPTAARGGADYWLWWQVVRGGGQLALLPDVLADYRIHAQQVSRREQSSISALVREVKAGIFTDIFGRPLGEKDTAVHFDMVDPGVKIGSSEGARIQRLLDWLGQLTDWLPDTGADRRIFSQLAIQALGKKGVRVKSTSQR